MKIRYIPNNSYFIWEWEGRSLDEGMQGAKKKWCSEKFCVCSPCIRHCTVEPVKSMNCINKGRRGEGGERRDGEGERGRGGGG